MRARVLQFLKTYQKSSKSRVTVSPRAPVPQHDSQVPAQLKGCLWRNPCCISIGCLLGFTGLFAQHPPFLSVARIPERGIPDKPAQSQWHFEDSPVCSAKQVSIHKHAVFATRRLLRAPCIPSFGQQRIIWSPRTGDAEVHDVCHAHGGVQGKPGGRQSDQRLHDPPYGPRDLAMSQAFDGGGWFPVDI